MAVRREYVSSLYRDLLGREGSAGEVEGHLNNPGGEQGLYDFFKGSPEYTAKNGGQAAWQDKGGQVVPASPYQTQGAPTSNTQPVGTPAPLVTPDSPTQPPASLAPPPPSGAPYTGFTPKHDYSAFDTARGQDPRKSAKDAFAMLSNQAPPPPFHDRKGMASWFSQYVQPGMQALGHKVSSVNEDGFTYANHEGTFFVDFGQNSGAAPGSMLQRLQWNATPADDATRARYAGSGGGAPAPGGAKGGNASGSQRTGAGSAVSDIRSVFQNLPPSGTNFSGPGDAGVTKGPLQQVGQDPFSTLITNALGELIRNQGRTDLGNSVDNAISALLDRSGELDPNQTARRFESARELLDKGRRTMVNDLRGDLASRNLLSEPGIPQGAEIGGLNRVTEKITPEFSRALRDIFTDESAKADTRLMTSLGMAMNVSSEQARTMLAALGEGTNRQAALADIALRNLAQNQAWSQFLARFGLERDSVMYSIQNGQIDSIMPILQAFLQLNGMANQGYI